jgi:hypothetical protein
MIIKCLKQIGKIFCIFLRKEYIIKYTLREKDTGKYLSVVDDYSDNDLEFYYDIKYVDMYDSTERLKEIIKHFYWYGDSLEIVKLKIKVKEIKSLK